MKCTVLCIKKQHYYLPQGELTKSPNWKDLLNYTENVTHSSVCSRWFLTGLKCPQDMSLKIWVSSISVANITDHTFKLSQ